MGFFIGLAVGLGIWCAWWNVQDRRKFREDDAYRAFVIYQKAQFARNEEATRATLESYRCEVNRLDGDPTYIFTQRLEQSRKDAEGIGELFPPTAPR